MDAYPERVDEFEDEARRIKLAEAEVRAARATAQPPSGSCLACGYDRPWVIFHVAASGEPTTGLCAMCKRGADEAAALPEPPIRVPGGAMYLDSPAPSNGVKVDAQIDAEGWLKVAVKADELVKAWTLLTVAVKADELVKAWTLSYNGRDIPVVVERASHSQSETEQP